MLVGIDKKRSQKQYPLCKKFVPNSYESPFGDGTASEKIVEILERYHE